MADEATEAVLTMLRIVRGEKWQPLNASLDAFVQEYYGQENSYIDTLETQIDEIQRTLKNLRVGQNLGRAARALNPNLVFLDVSDVLPEKYWDTFAAETEEEWLAWLVSKNVDDQKARQFLATHWTDENDD